MYISRRLFVLGSFLCVLPLAVPAVKRPLTHRDYDSWRNIQNQTLSPDGKYLAYAVFPQAGDGEVVIRDLKTGQERREPAGERPPTPRPNPLATGDERPEPPAVKMAFTPDGQFLVFSTFAPKAEADKAKAQKKPVEPLAKGLVVIGLSGGAVTRAPDVDSFQVSEKGHVLAYLKKPAQPAAGRGPRTIGSDLVVRRLDSAAEQKIADVTEFALSKDGASLVYAVGAKDDTANGVFALTPGGGNAQPVLAGKGRYTKLTWDDAQTQMAFLADQSGTAAAPQWKVYRWMRNGNAAAELPAANVSENGTLQFTKNGEHLFLGVAPAVREAAKQGNDDIAEVDLWHYKDDRIQPMQKVRAELDRNRSYRAVVHLKDNKFVQLADEKMADITPSEDGLFALGSDDREYRPVVEYDERYADAYFVDTRTGERKLLSRKHRGQIIWSPDGKYALLFNGKDWSSVAVPEGTLVNLTGKLGVNFYTEDNDTPGTPTPYAPAAWSKDGKWALLYDHYDLWQVSPDGREAHNLTQGMGRNERLMFRAVKLNPEAKTVDLGQPLLLRAEHADTHGTGFYRLTADGHSAPQRLIYAAKNFSNPLKAKNADVYVLTSSTFQEFPDLAVTDASFRELRQVSHANPQQSQYLWGTAELVKFESTDGIPLNGVLYKPENFDPQKKYPMIVYIYEKLSQNVNQFVDPKPGHSINITYYVSNGYLIFTPDIVYKIGYPGESALKCVLPGVQAVVDRGFVDEKAIGIQGHSWGGYQIAYMVTQTNRFKAAEAGAPVANMTSAYNGIRWGPGLPRQFQYERTQSRIGGSLWQFPLRYLENSPVFHADKVQTPLLILHNDADDAVPWYQGIEYYLALRRLGKEAYLFNYNGEPHHLLKRANQMDYTIRMQQYFDHYLKGAAEPEWMKSGIPYLEREQEKRKLRELVTDAK